MTLLLIALWVGAGMGIWFRRDPWQIEYFESRPEPLYMAFPGIFAEKRTMPDGVRDIGPYSEVANEGLYGVHKQAFLDVVYDRTTQRVIYRFVDVDMHSNTLLVHSDDAFDVHASIIRKVADGTKTEFGLLKFRRRFPEWWWGHFYRVEVWVFGVVSVVLIWRGVGAWRKRRG